MRRALPSTSAHDRVRSSDGRAAAPAVVIAAAREARRTTGEPPVATQLRHRFATQHIARPFFVWWRAARPPHGGDSRRRARHGDDAPSAVSVPRMPTLLEALERLFPESSRTTLRQMLERGRVRVNGEVEKNAKRAIRERDDVDVGQRNVHRILPPSLQLLHEDEDVLVVVKANGLLTVATARETETTAQAYLNKYLGSRGEERIHVVHRLDRETSGVLIFAKNFRAREALKEQFAAHSVDRVYVAIIEGALEPPKGTFRSNLLERRDLHMVSVRSHPDAKRAVTHYRTVERSDRYSMLEITLETGRKNQIRAHLSEAKHPIVGDQFYGSTVNPLARLGLHAKLLGFVHPSTGEKMKFTSPVPKVFEELFA
jgi:23S rRNA pseudouridine1911/1915/1917 synthase